MWGAARSEIETQFPGHRGLLLVEGQEGQVLGLRGQEQRVGQLSEIGPLQVPRRSPPDRSYPHRRITTLYRRQGIHYHSEHGTHNFRRRIGQGA